MAIFLIHMESNLNSTTDFYIYANNCTIFLNDITLISSGNNTIQSNYCSEALQASQSAGINANIAPNCNFINNTCVQDLCGFYLEYVPNSTLTQNNCSLDSWYGIYIDQGNNCSITRNTCNYGSDEVGIDIEKSNNFNVSYNNCTQDGLSYFCNGMQIGSCSNGFISYNNCSFDGNNGIVAEETNLTFTYDVCTNNQGNGEYDGNGIISQYSPGIIISYCNCSLNTENGIEIQDDSGTISFNNCSGNQEYGIYSYINDPNILYNTCTQNHIEGILIDYENGDQLIGNNCL